MSEDQTVRDQRKVIPIEEFQQARDRKEAQAAGEQERAADNPGDECCEGSTGGTMNRFARLLRDEVEELPGVRREKVGLVRDRLRARYYDRPDVLAEVANRILSGVFEEDTEPTDRDEP